MTTNQTSPHDEVVETVARAIAESAGADLWDRWADDVKDVWRKHARAAIAAFPAAQPEPLALTDAEWHAFQSIPEQGYSHRAWVDARIAERVAATQVPPSDVK